ncbi:MAG: glycoside hydrolase family 3 protein [Flavobacteriaceae bacterium]|nr:glycoside hydrolase family 3 protein [Bacteroidia bacterium]NNF75290.1 glycoside hydrolase family 3 protein [Flavobacteriaceae bacterium]NNK72199.1 glycoside hydrolase family 3 protein [Flavobacteriaceae bacterium]
MTILLRTGKGFNKYTIGILSLLFSINMAFSQSGEFSLDDFYRDNSELKTKSDSIFNTLNDKQRVGQMIFASIGTLGRSEVYAKNLIGQDRVGGFVILKGSKASHAELIRSLNRLSETINYIRPMFSIDAEPSLFEGRMQGSLKMKNTIEIASSREADSVAKLIAQDIKSIGIHQNYAPVVDISPNNEAIKSRSFGSDAKLVIDMSNAFIKGTQACEVVATAKHFPGHGLVQGDTHKNTVFIDGEMMEVDNYIPLIKEGVLSIMVAHIEVKNNSKYDTEGLPASCSPVIVKELLKEQLGFKGLIITDALNMEAVKKIGNPALKASMAGCDIILMPDDEAQAVNDILTQMATNLQYRKQVYESVKKILRMKICLGIID